MRHPPRSEQVEIEIELDESDLEEIDPSQLRPVPPAAARRRFDTLDEPLLDGEEATRIRARSSVPPPLPRSASLPRSPARSTVPPPSALGHRSVPPPPPRPARTMPPPRAMPPRARRAG